MSLYIFDKDGTLLLPAVGYFGMRRAPMTRGEQYLRPGVRFIEAREFFQPSASGT